MEMILYTIAVTHLTIICVTLYLHRCQCHRSIHISPVLSHLMRFWLWLTTGMVTKEWVSIHRKHHQTTDQIGDPHSPKTLGILTVLLTGASLYAKAAADRKLVDNYGSGSPDDWIEEHVYSCYQTLGLLLMLIIDMNLFGAWGFLIWGIQMIWIPLWAAGVVNGIGHYYGYRNTDTKDHSKNIFPIGILIGGEELHNNHHHSPAYYKFSEKYWEFDIGYMYIRLGELVGLIKRIEYPNKYVS